MIHGLLGGEEVVSGQPLPQEDGQPLIEGAGRHPVQDEVRELDLVASSPMADGAPLKRGSSQIQPSPMTSIQCRNSRAVLLVICIHWPSLHRQTR